MDPETIKKLITLVFIAIVSLLFLIFVASYTQSGFLTVLAAGATVGMILYADKKLFGGL
ncbi:MAG TPA: hypothetical protein VJH94_03300 [Candidatus Paceibacterota bacterium]